MTQSVRLSIVLFLFDQHITTILIFFTYCQANPIVYLGGDDGPLTEIRFEKCKEGVSLYRDASMQSTIYEESRPHSTPLSPTSKTKEMFALSETISRMGGMRIDDQRCSLTKVIKLLGH